MKFQIFIFSILLISFNFEQIKSQFQPTYNRNTSAAAAAATTTTGNGNDEVLRRIYNQIFVLSNNSERQTQNLEALKNRLEQHEINSRDQLNSIQNEVKEFEHRLQTFQWLITRSEDSINQLKNEFLNLQYNLSSNIVKREQPSDNNPDCSNKLDAIATFLVSIRSAIHKLEKHNDLINSNLTVLSHSISEIFQRQSGLPSKQYLHSALNSLRPQLFYGQLQQSVGQSNLNVPQNPISCAHAASTATGIHKIQLGPTKNHFYVLCDNDVEGGGWTVIQNRYDGSINFNRNWLEYKSGFGNLASEFFIGLDKLHDMTSAMLHELLILLEDFEGTKKFARYKQFAIADEKEDYALRILGEYEGDAGDSLSYSASYKFSTFDNDNDGWVEGNCALAHTGAWWYNACEMSNLNGKYLAGEVTEANQFQGMYWNEFRGSLYSLKSVKMMIRPIDRNFIPDFN